MSTEKSTVEKAVKALWYLRAGDPWGHSVQKLIADLESFDTGLFAALRGLLPDGSKLDKYCIPTRYPNGLPGPVPEEAYLEDDALSAIALSEKTDGANQVDTGLSSFSRSCAAPARGVRAVQGRPGPAIVAAGP